MTKLTRYRFHSFLACDKNTQHRYSTHASMEGAAKAALAFLGILMDGDKFLPFVTDDGIELEAGTDYYMDTPGWIPYSWCDHEKMMQDPYGHWTLEDAKLIALMRDKVLQTGSYRQGWGDARGSYFEITPVVVDVADADV